MLKKIEMKDAENIFIHGRTTDCRSPLTLFWSASGLEMLFRGRELWLECETDYTIHAPWLSVLLNGEHISRFILPKGHNLVPIIYGLNSDRINKIEIVRDIQSMPEDEKGSLIHIHALHTDGEFLEIPPKTIKLEIIGDSLTSSEGTIGSTTEEDWIAPIFCAVRGYPFRMAQLLNADLRVISQSGWGALTAWDNNPNCRISDYYEQVCGTLKIKDADDYGAFELNDFEKWNADVVVVNLCTNDNAAFDTPAWVDKETGITYKQRKNNDGTPNAEDMAKLSGAIYDFIIKIRKYNPNAYILWAYGMVGAPLKDMINDTVERYRLETGDQRAEFVLLYEEPQGGYGARNHPGKPMHDYTANRLVEKIKSI